ncbi:DUF2075 domain-containing protein [Lactobacillus sp. CC-MHH1034]|uniref:DUF2075 domain-containing protein n=1 Tax=Agrilactobacillus fermenti TaxID=2586909 RepID=UPI001E50532D|nr:DUF2075 domain-containing protein [Agrilactobacillus fermenti]MCD2257410.1 DUF2075 domain-containing protein [Agrilactobacillus fermenti]
MQTKGTFLLDSTTQLNAEQQQLQNRLLNFIMTNLHKSQTHLFVIEGDAGTGKSALINEIFCHIQRESRLNQDSQLFGTKNSLLVNHPEMLKIYQYLAGQTTELYKKDFQKPTTFINQQRKNAEKADIVFVDEAHLLLTQSDRYNHFNQQNQLAEIIKSSKVVILVFDLHQVLKLKSYWNKQMIKVQLSAYPHEIYHLKRQMRVTNQAMIDWIDQFTQKRTIAPLPKLSKFDFRIFQDGVPLYQQLQQKNKAVGLSRMIATADFPYKLSGGDWFVTAGKLRLPWDKINRSEVPWAMRPETIHEVGSIYTIQGFDLNYAGVILGPSVTYDPVEGRIKIKADQYQDSEAFKKRHDLTDIAAAKVQIILNSINVLLKRGRYGLYLYAVDPILRQALWQQAQ